MGLLDILLLLFIVGLALLGWRSGLIQESAGLLGLVLGLVVAGRYYEQFGPYLVPWLHTRGMSNLGAFVLILVGTWVAVLLAGTLARELLRGLRLGWLDNLGGMFFGVAKGLLIAQVVVLILMAVPNEQLREAVTDSLVGRRLAETARDIMDLVPPVLRYWEPLQ